MRFVIFLTNEYWIGLAPQLPASVLFALSGTVELFTCRLPPARPRRRRRRRSVCHSDISLLICNMTDPHVSRPLTLRANHQGDGYSKIDQVQKCFCKVWRSIENVRVDWGDHFWPCLGDSRTHFQDWQKYSACIQQLARRKPSISAWLIVCHMYTHHVPQKVH